MKNHIQEVLDIEKRAQAINQKALAEAEKLPITAEREAVNLLESSIKKAGEEAAFLVEKAKSQADVQQIHKQAEEKTEQMKTLALNHYDRAVGFVLDQVAGRG